MSSNYRFAAPFVVRLLGLGLALVGVLVLLLAGVVLAASLPAAVLSVGLVVAVVVALLVLAGVAALRRRVVVRLDAGGYRVRSVRGAGVREARWKDVEDVTSPTVEGQRCVVLRLRDGRTTTIPVDVLAGPADAFVRDLQQHLDTGHGYRRLA
ncbi:hypothetical protein KRR39_19415 [Nocardioides panacis]|uniref:PH domain-containing protein n=1 Tax=Nocardioides panacis TaxID=2849501 RepID=A0A975SX64_9ACTN|nr:hypothetical protein [Nocardioides panacis]QWZ07574.1 hypothetical protein KRR39_19415 [Nocardioides panacis]